MTDKIISGKISVGKNGIYLHAASENGYRIDFSVYNSPELKCAGINNITKDQKFILFADFDDISYDKLKDQLNFINKNYGVGHFLILTTGKGKYHVISFEKFLMNDLIEILQNIFCDYSYKRMDIIGKQDKGWILRISEKKDLDGNVIKDRPQFVDFIYYGEPKRKLSRAHLELFSKLYPKLKFFIQEKLDEKFWDEFTVVELLKYPTTHQDLLVKFGLDNLINSKKLEIIWKDEDNGK